LEEGKPTFYVRKITSKEGFSKSFAREIQVVFARKIVVGSATKTVFHNFFRYSQKNEKNFLRTPLFCQKAVCMLLFLIGINLA
jgi:hypothetical protein